jgi:N-formylglutamate amidohydrolase
MRIILLFLLLIQHSLSAQTFEPGQVYFDENGWIEYQVGAYPLIISVPHGGTLNPSNLPDRDCAGCVYVMDSNTQPLSRALADAVEAATGCRPHVVINLLHRRKLDANRDLVEAADGNLLTESAWYAYHRFIDSAKQLITRRYGRGLFIDMHGHGHVIQRLELGYLVTKSQLQLSDAQLNADYANLNSIELLIEDNQQALTFAALIRGETSLGSLLTEQGYPAVPSSTDPFPDGDEPYFNGGYNTNRHGSNNGGDIDGIQIECNSAVRSSATNYEIFTDSLARSLSRFLSLHYFGTDTLNFCGNPSSLTIKTPESLFDDCSIGPNPFVDYVRIDWPSAPSGYSLEIYNAMGQRVAHLPTGASVTWQVPLEPSAFYLILLKNTAGRVVARQKIIQISTF